MTGLVPFLNVVGNLAIVYVFRLLMGRHFVVVLALEYESQLLDKFGIVWALLAVVLPTLVLVCIVDCLLKALLMVLLGKGALAMTYVDEYLLGLQLVVVFGLVLWWLVGCRVRVVVRALPLP